MQGGTGPVLLCLPGWPQTWYSYRSVALPLAGQYTVIVVDIRGMGSSATPPAGYDKKTMATDIYRLMGLLGIGRANVLGHDIGGMVAASLAHNYPDVVERLILADGLHPNEGTMQMKLIPDPGTFGDKIDQQQPYTWWMSFNQVKDLPEKLLEGRYRFLLDWLFGYVMVDDSKMPDFERNIYASVYDQPERIRASNAWYQAFNQDIADAQHYSRLQMPVLGIASNVSYGYYQYALPAIADDHQLVHLESTGHYMFEENPLAVYEAIIAFLAHEHH
ncbi:alpha/beta fold hydrolase [Mucilaginibacter sp. 21P]|uniref:alpha/beta fold hydrolase n=1 Tax=Mucilaginibacter sp. 21P TaxID=2778902 RepID=UPI002103DB03|nr:alpha/beta hydrolase [Mucilaginibacter sp. 21P]